MSTYEIQMPGNYPEESIQQMSTILSKLKRHVLFIVVTCFDCDGSSSG